MAAISPSEIVAAISPPDGKIQAIRTFQQVHPPEDYGLAWVAEVDQQQANTSLKALQNAFPFLKTGRDKKNKDKKGKNAKAEDPKSEGNDDEDEDDDLINLRHLRRFCSRGRLPMSVNAKLGPHYPEGCNTMCLMVGPLMPTTTEDEIREVLTPFKPPLDRRPPSPTSSHSSWTGNNPRGKSADPSSDEDKDKEDKSPAEAPVAKEPLNLIQTRVPLYPPTNLEQAKEWTANFWETTFNAASTKTKFAPNPRALKDMEMSLSYFAGHYLALARAVAAEAEESGRGRAVGAVIVDLAVQEQMQKDAWDYGFHPLTRWMQPVIAVAGDARFAHRVAGEKSVNIGKRPTHDANDDALPYNADEEGSPDLHAMMRAAALVGLRRLEISGLEPPLEEDIQAQLLDDLTPLESYFLYDMDKKIRPSPHLLHPGAPGPRRHNDEDPETIDHLMLDEGSSVPGLEHGDEREPEPRNADDQPGPSTTPAARIKSQKAGGYLCRDLAIFLSREPCVCCSMAMVQSRFETAVYPQIGRTLTGGLASESVIDQSPPITDEDEYQEIYPSSDTDPMENRVFYGLNFRKELNWRFPAFEYIEERPEWVDDSVLFHA
ncbi:hypothetical protein N7532_009023 [Penicillium argentinense]|uniref:CMP/dCMP-type deaminase domain-containing protein n=1 Tax=Penicillium argentinense TaxID=1131581 RepID=A0A9W9EYN7_9EURO|nr:uncharacterized protein N7532_009023 [Penicillium argentinense]KAJ5090339.1 hypothetical protein N7532_009023 [Penicillium argentinense]